MFDENTAGESVTSTNYNPSDERDKLIFKAREFSRTSLLSSSYPHLDARVQGSQQAMSSKNHITLRDGRKLTYAEFGKPGGYPVMYFHGSPGSRLEPLLLGNEALIDLGLRVIAPDRPGMGGSDFQTNRRFSDWPKDVVALADAVGFEKFAVLGNSGGGPYAAVCAARIPERISAAVIVSGGWRMNIPEARDNLPLPNRLAWILAGKAPFLLRLLLKSMVSSPKADPEKELAIWKKRVPQPDYVALCQPGRLKALNDLVRESMHQGTKGVAWDMGLYAREFDFALDEIRMPITLFHGEMDRNYPIAAVRKVVSSIRSARLVTFDNEAHLSTLTNHVVEIAAALLPTV